MYTFGYIKQDLISENVKHNDIPPNNWKQTRIHISAEIPHWETPHNHLRAKFTVVETPSEEDRDSVYHKHPACRSWKHS